jgi:hypothetical protein
MREGWYEDYYLVLFDESEIAPASDRYEIRQLLADYEVIGLHGWDDFIVRDASGQTYSVPTVPLTTRDVEPFNVPKHGATLKADPRFKGKIKWYVQPLAFAGNPQADENIIWVDHAKHSELVRFWNEQYRQLGGNNPAKGQ